MCVHPYQPICAKCYSVLSMTFENRHVLKQLFWELLRSIHIWRLWIETQFRTVLPRGGLKVVSFVLNVFSLVLNMASVFFNMVQTVLNMVSAFPKMVSNVSQLILDCSQSFLNDFQAIFRIILRNLSFYNWSEWH